MENETKSSVLESEQEKQPEAMEERWERVSYTYINSSQTIGSNWDVRILFSERLSKGKTEPRLGIVMSHSHAKAFLEALSSTLSQVEKMLGAPVLYKPAWTPADKEGTPET